MKPETASLLIEEGVERTGTKQTWADLGAGNGVFTRALSIQLHDGSTLYAVDTDVTRMASIRVWQQIVLKVIHADFMRDIWTTEPLDGIMMANSLHFVKDKPPFLQKMKARLKPSGRLLIVEYEMEKGNTWVPYPVGFNKLSEAAIHAGFSTVKKLQEVPSVYENRMIYSVVIS